MCRHGGSIHPPLPCRLFFGLCVLGGLLVSQALYAQLGARSALVRACHDLPSRLELRCDGQLVELPGEHQHQHQHKRQHKHKHQHKRQNGPLPIITSSTQEYMNTQHDTCKVVENRILLLRAKG